MKNVYDAIIVGTGVAGCFAALHLPEDWEILMITKGTWRRAIPFWHREESVCSGTRVTMTVF